MTKGIKNILLTESATNFANELKDLGIFAEIQEAFRFGIAIALNISPDEKEKNWDYKGSDHTAITVDQDGNYSFAIKEISSEIEDEMINERMRFLGSWGLEKIKSDYWDEQDRQILWDKMNKDTR